MKLTLIRPNLGDYRSSDAMAPLGLAILAARAPDCEIAFYDERIEPVPLDAQTDLVALSVETYTARRAYEIADAYRARGMPVVMGGYHPTFLPDEALRHADAVVIGDAEGVWERLLDDARTGRLETRYVGDAERPMTDYAIDRRIFDGKRYAPVEVVQYGRGCRFACEFCSIHSFYGNSVRHRALDGLLAEIAALPANRLLFFVDDNLYGPREEFLALLKAMAPLKRRWSCQISIDVARDDVLMDALVEAGCRFVLIGFESLSADNLRQMGKPWNQVSGAYRDVVRSLHRRGIGIYGTFVFGYDADTPEVIERTVDFALDARLELANFNALTPTPGSPLYARLQRENRLVAPDWWIDPLYRYGDPIFQPRGLSADELALAIFDARKRFYRWGAIARRVLDGHTPFSWPERSMVAIANVISRREIFRKQYRHLGT